MGMMRKWKRKMLAVAAAGTMVIGALPGMSHAATGPDKVSISQGVGKTILDNANYFGDMDPNALVTVDIVLKVKNQDQLQQYIKDTVTPGSPNYKKFLSVQNFSQKYAPSQSEVNAIIKYLQSFGLSTKAYPDNLVITATGQVKHFNEAFNVDIQKASYKGKAFHAVKNNPTVPAEIGQDILCILGLSDYSNLASNAVKQANIPATDSANSTRMHMTPQDLVKQYNLRGLYDKGATGKGQTIGIVTLADFNEQDAYKFWDQMGIKTNKNRITKVNVDGGSGWDGYDETSLDVEQSGALAPDANINVYVAPNTDTGFVDGFAQAINDNVAQQISVSWGESETFITAAVQANQETPEYANVFNQLYMQAAAQGVSMFAAAGDAGAYDTSRMANYFDLSVDNPADSPYITAAGGTTLPQNWTSSTTGLKVIVDKERAWSWDYLYPLFGELGLDINSGEYNVGGGGGFSQFFGTPDYQQGVSGVNSYTGVTDFLVNNDFTASINPKPSSVTGSVTDARNMPDLSMNADPETGYLVYYSAPGNPGKDGIMDYGWGGTSFVSPQLNGISALINSVSGSRTGFWNPQIYRFAQEKNNSPFTPLNDQGTSNDNLFYTGTTGTIYNQATGLGTPDVTALANQFISGK
jgi:kumamolisin